MLIRKLRPALRPTGTFAGLAKIKLCGHILANTRLQTPRDFRCGGRFQVWISLISTLFRVLGYPESDLKLTGSRPKRHSHDFHTRNNPALPCCPAGAGRIGKVSRHSE